MTPEELVDEVATGRTVAEWMADPCFALCFGAVRQTILTMFEACKTEPEGVYDLKLALSALRAVEGAAREFASRGEIAQRKLEEIRKKQSSGLFRVK